MSRLTFLKCLDYPSCQHRLFFWVEIFKMKIFWSRFIFVEIFIEIVKTNRDCRDKSILSRQIETVETNRDCQDLSRLIKIFWHYQDFFKTFSRFQAQKSGQIEKSQSRNVITLTNSQSRSRQTLKICQKCHVSIDFSIETFGTERWCRD